MVGNLRTSGLKLGKLLKILHWFASGKLKLGNLAMARFIGICCRISLWEVEIRTNGYSSAINLDI